jgi:hypothetical protein
MNEGGLAFSLVSIIAAIACLSLCTYVLFKNPHLKSSKIFIFLTIMGTLTGLSEFLLITAPDESAALFFARPTLFFSLCAAASLLYLTSFLPYERERSWLVSHKLEFLSIAIVVAVLPALSVDTVLKDEYGWWVAEGPAIGIWVVASCAYCAFAVILMAQLRKGERRETMRQRIVLLTFGAAIPLLTGLVEIFAGGLGPDTPPVLSATVLASCLIFAYGLFRQKMFVLEPAPKNLRAANPISTKEVYSVLVEAKTSDPAYQLFVKELALEKQGLLITRIYPDRVREGYELRKTPILWLTTKPGPDSIDPTSISVLRSTMVRFLERGDSSVILLDGLEYLLSYNSMEKTLMFVFELRDVAIVAGSKLIVSVDPESIGTRELSMLERELEVVR